MARVYVIDDDEQLLRMVGLMLQRGGHTTTLISNPIDGLEQIKADKPDLLFVDGFVHAPGKDKRDYMQNLEYIISTIEY